MNRRHFVFSTLASGLAAVAPRLVHAAPGSPAALGGAGKGHPAMGASRPRCVIVIELMGGNDGLNTIVPHADPLYRRARPTLALGIDDTVPLDGTRRLHAALAPMLPLWQAGEWAIVDGVGTSGRPLAHFRAAQAWRSGSHADTHRSDDWLARAVAARAGPPVLSLSSDRFGDAARRAADAVIGDPRIGAVRLALPGFDTHHRQRPRHAAALAELAGGIDVLHRRLRRAGRWNDVVVMTTSEFGRALAENATGGTDHGAAAPQFLLGGGVRGGWHGASAPLSAQGGAPTSVIDHRRVLGAVLASWWNVAPAAVLDGPPAALPGLFRI